MLLDTEKTREQLIAELDELRQRVADLEGNAPHADRKPSYYDSGEADRVVFLHNFIEDASHDIKTPLTILKTSQFILSKIVDDDEALMRIHKSIESIERLEHIINDMLTMAHLDQLSDEDLLRDPVNMTEFVFDVLNDFQELAVLNNQNLLFTYPEDAVTNAIERDMFEQAVAQIIDNALRYTPAGGEISVDLYTADHVLKIAVRDEGPGIPDAELPLIFNRFYRGEEHRPSTGSTGLGLSIAREIVRLHGGRVVVESHPGQGTIFTIVMPVG